MPRLNTLDGRAVQGTTSISVNGVVPAALAAISGNAPRWFDEAGSVIVYQNNTAGSVLQTLDLDGGSPSTVSTAGANELGAGGSVWAAFLSTGANVGLRTSIGGFTRRPLAGPADVDEDGKFAYVQNFQAGMGIAAFSAAGAETAKWDVQLPGGYVIRCRSGLCAYPATGFVWALRQLSDGTPVPMSQRSETVNYTVPLVLASGRVLLLERSERLTLREATTSQGWVLTEDDTFTPDCIELSPGVVRIAYASTAGEGPTTLRLIDLTISSGATSLGTSAGGSGVVFTTGPTLTALPLPATGGSALGLLNSFIRRHPIATPSTGILTVPWWQFFEELVASLGNPVNVASQTTGVLPEEQGGTGQQSGLTILDATNVTLGTLPQNVKWTQFDTAATGTQHNVAFDSGTTQADYIRAANASTLTITGLAAGVPGQRLVVQATNAAVELVNASGSSTAENRILTFDGATATLSANEAALLEYDGTSDRWRLIFISAAAPVSDPAFGVISVTGQTDVDATIPTDEVEFVASTGITITTDAGATPKQVIFATSGGGSWFPLVDGSEPPVFVTDGAGVLIAVPYSP